MTPQSLQGGACVKWKPALGTARTVFLSQEIRHQSSVFLAFVSKCHEHFDGPSKWRFVYDEAEFRRIKAKKNTPSSHIGWVHRSERAAFCGTKHVFVELVLKKFLITIDHTMPVR